MAQVHSRHTFLAVVGIGVLLSGCIKDGPKATESTDTPPTTSVPPPASTNSKPSITGTPPASVVEGEKYDFQPTASDPDGDQLTFSVSNKPTWASFETSTGRLYGTPGAGTSGSYGSIVISVSDGKAVASLSAYTLTVNQISMGSATLSWNPPTQNTDGSTLTDLAGYKIYYGKASTNLDNVVTITQAGITRYVVENLSPATWYFSMTSFTSLGVESSKSAVVSKTIS
jgi:hypothetical protein